MPPTAPRPTGQDGFTLIEILVVILIVGILAAIALPVFLGQQKKGQDSSAKADARNLQTQVESCFAGEEDYRRCDTAGELGTTGLSFGTGEGQVAVDASARMDVAVSAKSRTGTTFTITKVSGERPTRGCDAAGSGGCKDDGTW